MLRTVDATAPVVMSGSGAGIVSLASAGALQVDRPLLYAASFANGPRRTGRRGLASRMPSWW